VRVPETVFLVIGVALLGGAGALYYYDVQRPLSWPRNEATVVSSRVINPRNPNQHSPEVVLRFEDAGAIRQLTVRSNWSSSSYSMVKEYVDRYPAGAAISVAVNPDDAGDVRYELGPTFTNLIGPGVIGLLGLICAAIGLWTLVRPRSQTPASAADNARVTRRVGWLFAAIGAGIIAIGIWIGWQDAVMVRTWVAVDAESLAVRPITSGGSGGTRPSRTLYDVQVTFRYEVDGRRFESDSASGMASSSTGRRDELMARFAPGTRHRIHHRPDDPNVIRYNLDSFFTTFAASGGLVLMGLVFLAFGTLFSRVRFAPQRDGPPDIDAEDREIAQQERFRRR
jgi:hypothetical protein